jgi:hypothetical protein
MQLLLLRTVCWLEESLRGACQLFDCNYLFACNIVASTPHPNKLSFNCRRVSVLGQPGQRWWAFQRRPSKQNQPTQSGQTYLCT